MKKIPFLFTALLFMGACKNASEKKFVDIQGIDSTQRPENNFFRYVDGKWYDTAQIPGSQAGVGAYMFMNYPQRIRLQNILDSVSKADNTAGSIEQKIGDF
jgi:putative endopeptidase